MFMFWAEYVAMNRPAAPTVDGLTRRRFHYWTGRSGRSYIHSVYSPGERAHFTNAAVVLVADDGGRRVILGVGLTGALPELYFNSRSYTHALACGANQIHVHLASTSADARTAAADISAALADAQAAVPPKCRAADELAG